MKTTAGKTKTPPNNSRTIKIHAENDGKILATVEAVSLREALNIYFERTLSGYGYTKPKHNGNTLTVTNKMGRPQLYVALEVYQTHVLGN